VRMTAIESAFTQVSLTRAYAIAVTCRRSDVQITAA
jgi:hypothetical protein